MSSWWSGLLSALGGQARTWRGRARSFLRETTRQAAEVSSTWFPCRRLRRASANDSRECNPTSAGRACCGSRRALCKPAWRGSPGYWGQNAWRPRLFSNDEFVKRILVVNEGRFVEKIPNFNGASSMGCVVFAIANEWTRAEAQTLRCKITDCRGTVLRRARMDIRRVRRFLRQQKRTASPNGGRRPRAWNPSRGDQRQSAATRRGWPASGTNAGSRRNSF